MRGGVIAAAGYYLDNAAPPPPDPASVNATSGLKGVRTSNLPTGDFTVLFAANTSSAINVAGAFATITLSTSQAIEIYSGSFIMFPTDPEIRVYFDATSSDNVLYLPASGWYWFAVVRSGTTVTFYYKTDAATSWSSLSAGSHSAAMTAVNLFSWNDNTVDVAASTEKIRKLCIWSEAKSTATLIEEAKQRTLYSSANINGFYPLTDNTTAGQDTSGTGYNFTMSGGAGGITADEPAFVNG